MLITPQKKYMKKHFFEVFILYLFKCFCKEHHFPAIMALNLLCTNCS